jgi:hypothetical protein
LWLSDGGVVVPLPEFDVRVGVGELLLPTQATIRHAKERLRNSFILRKMLRYITKVNFQKI